MCGLHRGGVLVVNQSGGNADAVASHVLAMALMLSKQIIQTNHALRRGTLHDRMAFIGSDIHGRTIGIVGLGNVGRRVAELCRGLFGMHVIACDPYLDDATVAARGADKVTLDELLRRADFVSINCPLDETTRGMIGAREFALMQPHAFFITTARGLIHDERRWPRRWRASGSRAPGSTSGTGSRRRRASAAAIQQRDRNSAYRGRHPRGARQYGQDRRRAADHDARRQASAAHRQPAGVAGLCRAFRADVRFRPQD